MKKLIFKKVKPDMELVYIGSDIVGSIVKERHTNDYNYIPLESIYISPIDKYLIDISDRVMILSSEKK